MEGERKEVRRAKIAHEAIRAEAETHLKSQEVTAIGSCKTSLSGCASEKSGLSTMTGKAKVSLASSSHVSSRGSFKVTVKKSMKTPPIGH
jgi:hypothetical protein